MADKVANTLRRLGELRTVFEDNKDQMGVEPAKEIATKTKIQNIKRYIHSFLFAIPNKIKNESTTAPLEYRDKPDNWNVSQNYVDKLSDILHESGSLADKYIFDKRSNNMVFIFEALCLLIQNNNHDLNDMVAKEHELSCLGEIAIYSKCTNRNFANLLHFVFIIILKDMLTLNLDVADHISNRNVKKQPTIPAENSLDDIEERRNNATEMLDDDESRNTDSGSGPESDANISVDDMETNAYSLRCDLIIDILEEIEKNRSFMDKHSKT